MAWNAHLTQMRKRLAQLFSSEDDARRVVDQTPLNPAHITFTGKAVNTWHSILKEADLHGTVNAVIQAALDESENDTELSNMYQAYTDATGDSGEHAPKPSRPTSSNTYINTGGGAYIAGNVNTGGGNLTGRDSTTGRESDT